MPAMVRRQARAVKHRLTAARRSAHRRVARSFAVHRGSRHMRVPQPLVVVLVVGVGGDARAGRSPRDGRARPGQGRAGRAAGRDGRLRAGAELAEAAARSRPVARGWTWGSGAGVLAESPDKVWVAQRSEIQLPPGATPWICACLLTPRRTNTGRRPYSGKDYPYEQRRHHLVFAVDRDGNTIEEWLQHDRPAGAAARLRPRRGRPRPAQAAHQSLRSARSTCGSSTTISTSSTSSPTTASCCGRWASAACPAAARTTSTVPPTSRGCPTGRSSSPTATPARGWRSSTAPASS